MRKLCGTATKKPVTIHWFRWNGHSESHIHELEAWIESLGGNFKDTIELRGSAMLVKTLEGNSYDVPTGYIIIRGVKGEFYPCEPGIFNDTYDIL